jgi:hypothetical protein
MLINYFSSPSEIMVCMITQAFMIFHIWDFDQVRRGYSTIEKNNFEIHQISAWYPSCNSRETIQTKIFLYNLEGMRLSSQMSSKYMQEHTSFDKACILWKYSLNCYIDLSKELRQVFLWVFLSHSRCH